MIDMIAPFPKTEAQVCLLAAGTGPSIKSARPGATLARQTKTNRRFYWGKPHAKSADPGKIANPPGVDTLRCARIPANFFSLPHWAKTTHDESLPGKLCPSPVPVHLFLFEFQLRERRAQVAHASACGFWSRYCRPRYKQNPQGEACATKIPEPPATLFARPAGGMWAHPDHPQPWYSPGE